MQGSRYCVDECLELALRDALRQTPSGVKRALAPHRIPLGLLLLSRQQLTIEQLRAALDAQRSAGRGRIGEWLQALGFASEEQITIALARQWSCPVLRANVASRAARPSQQVPNPQVPLALLESSVMMPVAYIESTATLHVAFGEGIDYTVLYAIEQMVGCRTEACMAVPSFVRASLQSLAQRRGENEVVFEPAADVDEFARMIRSYSARIAASEIRLAACGSYLWARLLHPSRPPLDLLLRSRPEPYVPSAPARRPAAVGAS